MKGKQLTLVLVLLAALGGVALFLNQRNSASWSNTATTSSGKILDFQLNDVSQVTIKEGGAELNLVKKDDVWTVKDRADYPADFDKISTLIRKLWELRPVQDVKIGPSQLGRLQLTEPAQGSNNGTLLDLKGAGAKRLTALLLGKKYLKIPDQPPSEGGGIPVGRYVMGLDGSNRVFLVSETFDEIQMKPEQWLNRAFIKVENPKSIAAIAKTPAGMNWKIVRDAAATPWKLVDAKSGEELDSAKAAGLATLFANAIFADVLPPDASSAETGLDMPSTVRIETFDNFVYELRIGKGIGENYPVLVSVKAELSREPTPAADEKPEDKAKLDQDFQARQTQLADKLAQEQRLQHRPYLIAKSTIDQLLQDRSSLIAKKEPSPITGASPAPPKAVFPPKSPITIPRAAVFSHDPIFIASKTLEIESTHVFCVWRLQFAGMEPSLRRNNRRESHRYSCRIFLDCKTWATRN